MHPPTWLLDFKRDVYSQTGEDGIIEKILDVLPCSDRWCVEFGAWDGVFLTNTRHLILAKGFSAVLIEADRKKFQQLQHSYVEQGQRVVPLNRFVGFGDGDNLDCILAETPVPQDFDLLSIDIDGNDYHVWQRVRRYQPKLVVIEFNPTIPTDLRFVQEPHPAVNQGASLLSLVELGKEKGYELVCVLPFNAFFVKREYFPLFHIDENAPSVLRTDTSAVTHLFTGYDGRVLLRGGCSLPWHGVELRESRIQVLPWFLRRYPGRYSRFQKIGFALFALARQPVRFREMLRRQFSRLACRDGRNGRAPHPSDQRPS